MRSAKTINTEEIKAIVGFMSPYRRINSLIEYLGITKAEIACRHKCSLPNVCNTLNGVKASMPVQLTLYGMLQDVLGAGCPKFEALFDVPPEQEASNG